ncbi:MAG: Calx-beta domain-containing protein [Pseudomonadota bacterium]
MVTWRMVVLFLILFGSSSTVTLIDNIISGNMAGVYAGYSNGEGGGVYFGSSKTAILINNTISDNEANHGGGVWLAVHGTADIYNNIIWNNRARESGNDLYIGNGNNNLNLFNNDFDQSGSHITNPIFVDPSNLNNLDPLFDEDYHLQAGSPCIDAGDNSATLLPTTDQDGNPRIVNSIVDIGAYELQVPANSHVQFSAADYSINENGNTVTITVTRSGGSQEGQSTLNYATTSGTATSGSDYTQTTGTLSWADGDSADKTFTIAIIDDGKSEGDETFTITLTDPISGENLDNAAVTITDEDTTLVTLVEFIVMALEENEIIIEWQTATEFNNAGYYLWRAIWKESDFSNVVRLTGIAPKGDFSVYSYIDTSVEAGITYYYGLEDIDLNGQSTFHWDLIDSATAR